MGDQSFDASDPTATQGSHRTGRNHTTAGDAFSKASDMARDAGARAKRAAADTASSMSDSVMGLLMTARQRCCICLQGGCHAGSGQ
jgi:hypothetical protein